MRTFEAGYLRRTRAGMWDDSRAALDPLELPTRSRVLDVGCGTGELSRVISEECSCETIGCDADQELLVRAREHVPVVCGDATSLPFSDDAFDLVVCQALLINLKHPTAALEAFARVSTDLVAVIEPDNSAVEIDSTVDAEPSLERVARRAYLDGVETDVTLGENAASLMADAGIDVLDVRRYDHDRTIEPPYDEHALTVARRKATGAGLADDKATMLHGSLTPEAYDDLRTAWREMGRDVIDQMREGRYSRTETVPFYVTVGRVQNDRDG